MVVFEDRIGSPVKRITLAQMGHLVAAQDPADGAGQQPQLGPGQSCPRNLHDNQGQRTLTPGQRLGSSRPARSGSLYPSSG